MFLLADDGGLVNVSLARYIYMGRAGVNYAVSAEFCAEYVVVLRKFDSEARAKMYLDGVRSGMTDAGIMLDVD